MKTIEGEAYAPSAVLALGAWSCSQPKKPPKPTPPRFSIAHLDGAPLTRYAPEGGKVLTEAIPGTSVRRSFVILNDPACPVKISAFGFTMDYEESQYSISHSHCTLGEQLANSGDCPYLLYSLDWAFKAQSPVTAWEAKAYAFDQMNRYLWTDNFANGTHGKDATGLELGTEYKTDRLRWWTIQLADNLGKWVNSVVFVTAARTKDGKVWICDKEALKSQIGALSLEITLELK
jgi:hypothetical protein